MEQLKRISSLLDCDERFKGWMVRNRETGASRAVELEDLYVEALALTMPAHIPDAIRDAFTTALNLWVYGWFHYPFCTTAFVNVLLLVEQALKDRGLREGLTEAPNMSLRALMDAARARGWYRPQAVRHVERVEGGWSGWDDGIGESERQERLQVYLDELPEKITELRNLLAHPTGYTLLPPFLARLGIEIARDFMVDLHRDLAPPT